MQSFHHAALPQLPVNGHQVGPSMATTLVALDLDLDLDLELAVESLGPAGHVRDVVQEWGEQSFPASDPPANW